MKPLSQSAVLALGFRPFFLLGPAYVLLLLTYWSGYQLGLTRLPAHFSPTAWHAHEMMFGFVTAIIAGFLLTASKNWTNTRGVHGAKLLLLVIVWIAGRVAMWGTGVLPPGICAIIDLAFLPLLIGFLAATLLQGKKRANLLLLVWVGLLLVGNILMHLDALGLTSDTARRGYLLAVDAVVALMILMGGRVIPMFTQNAVPSTIIAKRPAVDTLTLVLVALYLCFDFMWAESRPTGFVAIAAGTAAAVRAWGWRPLTTLRHPILWVLHLGYTFVWAGLILRGLSMTVLNAQAAIALHVLTAGGMGLLILGMISRVSLGHTGRPLVASTSMTVAYALIALGATIRALTPVVFASGYIAALVISATLWMSGFALFSIQYWPVLTTPRIDGKVG